MIPFWQNLIKLILTISLLAGCAAIPGGNVKLGSYSQIDQSKLTNLDLSYERTDFGLKKVGADFSDKITKRLSFVERGQKKPFNKNCHVMISSNNDYGTSNVCQVYGILAGFTLFIVPAYCYWNYQVQASLIHYPSESSLRDKPINVNPKQVDFSNNKIQIKQTKKGNYLLTEDKQRINEGEYFLDENNNLAKLLKTYELKDKVHEVWSLLMILAGFAIKSLHELPSDDYGRRIVENTISEALVRSILNDASNFKECQKDQPLLPKQND